VSSAEEDRLDSVLSGAADSAREAAATLPAERREDFTVEARHAAVDAFAATNKMLAGVAFATAVVSLALLRGARTRDRERHHLAHAAAHVYTAHHLTRP
jgi:hypothetical protein